jgi:hypothetical protein
MKKLSITFGAILLALGCFALSPAVKADPRPTPPPRPFPGPSIVGLWHVSLYLDPDHTQLFAETYKQWHSDGLEFESANLAPGALCVGTWTHTPSQYGEPVPCGMDLRQPSWDRALRGDGDKHGQS